MGRPFPPDKPHETSVRATVGRVFTLLLPLAVVSTYRLIPARLRGLMFPGPSTSHLALADIHSGRNGWSAIRAHCRVTW